MTGLTDEQNKAYEWAINQGYQSVAARYAKLLAEALEQSRRETWAAVEDMKVMALAMRESEELSEGCCFACMCDAQNLPDNCILPYGECPGYEKTDCFEWRGPSEAGEET